MVPVSDPDLFQASAVRGRLNKRSDGTFFRCFAAAMVGPDEQRRQSPPRRMLKSLVKVPSVMCPFSSLIFLYLTALVQKTLEAA